MCLEKPKNKKCPKCRKVKPFSDFSKDRTHKYGLSQICKECRKVYYKKWREANLDKIKKRKKEYCYKNKERLNKRAMEWAARNPERRKLSREAHRIKSKRLLTNSYIKQLIYNTMWYYKLDIKLSEIPPMLIDLRRQKQLLKRYLNEQTNNNS